MKKVFISYAREDCKIAKRLYDDLQKSGINPWLGQEEILPGQDWRKAINMAIEECEYFIALLSSNSVSKKGYIQKELRIAIDFLDKIPQSDIFIIPIRINNCTPQHEKLKYLQWVDIFIDYDNCLEKILSVISYCKEDGKLNHASQKYNKINVNKLKGAITVVGVGGAGGNAINQIIDAGLNNIKSIVIDTDIQALDISKASVKLLIGEEMANGLGAGVNPDIGRAGALDSSDTIIKSLNESELVFITAGLGGGTGTGASPVIAELCRKLGFYTIMVASLPFSFEGRKRNLQAIDSLKELEKIVDLSISFPNDKLRRLVSNNMTMIEVFKVVDQILINGIKSFTDLLNKPGIVKLNLADLIRVICNSGRGYMGTGISNGKNRAIEAAERAMTHPLFDDVQLINADKFIVNVSANSSLTLDEVQKAIERISTEISVDSNLLWGSVIDNDLRNELKISLIVAGLKDAPSNEINIRKRETESDLRRNTNK